ncbi:TonB-dependent receptor plug domain-containing protein [Massilia dura]|uniref:TonB-dependent receptor plug domain-containing protein n=1 Tax=Pseudoduganella dura TaxID=321982 RepID=A0A6I3XNB1_9BURK|nr:TonB-dependent receptor [Pseudoduganella dura]MUI16050.1 TonB-dependent receptor plug domain-containing protein [Pseudoduganella dura]
MNPRSLLFAAVAIVALPGPAMATAIPLELPAGPAAVTLPVFARQANLRLLASGDELADVRTSAVHGAYTPRQALDRLLAGTGLAATLAGNAVLVQKRKAPPLPPSRPPAPAAPKPAHDAAPATVRILGTRAAERDSIFDKKNAATAVDIIKADEVGAFPDRNVAEAISRVAGVTLDRGDYGEGTTINVRANTAELVRVEIDGLGVQAAGGTDLNNGGSGRGVDLRELSTDLIKSIEVVKGSTVDMTEGSLGGGVLIRTRSGLDFDKRHVALRVAAQRNSINRRTTPNLNFIFADRFLDRRLGVVLNLTSSAAHNENHTALYSAYNLGTVRALDFDGSPEKTFSFNPATVNLADPAATAPMARWERSGGGTVDSMSPLTIVQRSAAAQSKADCHAAFPQYTAAQLATIAQPANRATAQSQRANELLTCLNQWNDYTPQQVRYQVRREYDERLYGDLRLDFKVSDALSVYAKFNRNTRKIDDGQSFYSLGNIGINTAGRYVDSGSAADVTRAPASGSNTWFYPSPANLGAGSTAWRGMTNGSVANVVPGSIVVDANHHLLRYTVTDANVNVDQIYDRIESSSQYMQAGGTWRSGALRVEFLAGHAKSDAWRMQWRTNFGYVFGQSTLAVAPNGMWTHTLPSGASHDQTNYANYGTLSNPSDPAAPRTSTATQLTMANPRIMERREDTARLDLTWATGDRVPFLSRLKFGLQHRNYRTGNWSGAGYTVRPATATSPAVVVPWAQIRGSFQACEDTPGSLAAGGRPCQYGINYGADPATAHSSTIVMTQARYRDIVAQSLAGNSIRYFNSAHGIPEGMVQGWTEIDVRKVIELTGAQHFNLDCVKVCQGSDGRMYEQPRTAIGERVLAGYLSGDFSVDRVPFTAMALPFRSAFEGNFGWRVVHAGVAGTGLMTFQSVTKTAAYNPADPNAAAGIVQSAAARNTTLRGSSTDVMPVLNLAWWTAANKVAVRYHRARAIARPPVQYLYSNNVSCTRDERRLDDGMAQDLTCDGTLGNPALRAMSSRNQNLSFEWYPDRDTILSLAGFRQRGLTGAPLRVAVYTGQPFADSGTIDPVSGAGLSELRYAYATYVNGPPTARNGIELSGKTAFSWLPSLLRYTGIDANYTRMRSRVLGEPIRDLLTGEALGPARELRYTWNASLWYDDGRLQARVAVQSAAGSFRELPAGANYYPAVGVESAPALAFNPASPTFNSSTRFVDARVAWRATRNLELFVEGRNIGRAGESTSHGAYAPYADGRPNLLDYSFAGAQYMFGIVIRN